MNESTIRKQIVLDKIRVACNVRVNSIMLQQMKLEKVEDFIADNLVYQLRGFLYGKSNIAEHEVYINLWHELRSKVLPKWWLRRYPSMKKKITFTAIYPSLNVAGRGYESHIIFETLKIPEVSLA